jgi:hypothetical protein
VTPSLWVLASVLGLAFASMPIYAIAARGRRDADATRKGSSFPSASATSWSTG